MQGVNREVIGRQQAQTGLIELQRLKESQAAEAELMRAAQTDPRVQAMLFGGSVLGSLGQPAPGCLALARRHHAEPARRRPLPADPGLS